MVECPILEDSVSGHVLLPFWPNRAHNGYEQWAAYEFDSRDDIDVACINGTPALVERYPNGEWYRGSRS